MKNTQQHTTRAVSQIIKGEHANDGDGVTLKRYIGTKTNLNLDPFLLFDHFEAHGDGSEVSGFPPHPHRGFQTVTYMLQGKMKHEDNQGHSGSISKGGVQWMNAGKGIVHSERPELCNGGLSGVQLWVNLPKALKDSEPSYQEYAAEQLPQEIQTGYEASVIAGETNFGTRGGVTEVSVQPLYIELNIRADAQFQQFTQYHHTAFIWVAKGCVMVGPEEQLVQQGEMAILSAGDVISLAAKQDSQLLIASAQAIGEPIVRGGPFVMNTRQELLQAFDDYANNQF